MTASLVIDFGTSRTKAAIRPEEGAPPELLRFGDDGLPHQPTLFHLPRGGGEPLFGDAAAAMLEEDPAGVVEVPKRRLRDGRLHVNGRAVTVGDLLERAFAGLRRQAGAQVGLTGGALPARLTLTVPVGLGRPEGALLTDAARAAGFSEVALMAEPVAAAHGWLAASAEGFDRVVVVDCGGGNVGWALVAREDGRFHQPADCPPGGIAGLGGHDVDLGLLELAAERLAEEELDAGAFGVVRQARLLARFRRLKEQVSRGRPATPVEVSGGAGGGAVSLSTAEVKEVIRSRFVSGAVAGLRAYLDRVAAAEASLGDARGRTPILLVGGSARLAGLREEVETLGHPVLAWDKADMAPVLGALASPPMETARRKGPAGARPVGQAGTAFRDVDEPWCPEMVVLPRGRVRIGSPDTEPERDKSDGPQRWVELESRTALGTCAVSFAEWDAFAADTRGYRPDDMGWGRGEHPVINVSLDDVRLYLDWLNGRLGLVGRPDRYRLPTAIEWEYGARAGASSPFWWGRAIIPGQANYDCTKVYQGGGFAGERKGRTVPVRSFAANPYGLYQMHGNVRELTLNGTLDGPHSFQSHGGGWASPPGDLRAARDHPAASDARATDLGFRLARTLG